MHIEAAGLAVMPQRARYRYLMAFPDTACGTVQGTLRKLGVLANKHIPLSYLRGSEAQRRALLAGILDTDGTVTSTGSIQLAVTNRELADGVRELVASLGYRCSMSTKRVKGRSEASSTCYMVNFTTPDRVFWLDRKHLLHKERLHHRPQRTRWRYIVDVRRVPSRPVRCVQVDSADRLYLAGRSMIPTHNSTLALDLARAASLKHGLTTVMFSLEMSRNEITMRLLSAESPNSSLANVGLAASNDRIADIAIVGDVQNRRLCAHRSRRYSITSRGVSGPHVPRSIVVIIKCWLSK